MGKCDVLLIAGEHSGDEHAARLIQGAIKKYPGLAVCALGGKAIETAGAQLLFDLTASSVVGVVEVLKNYRFFKNIFEKTVAWIRIHRPKTICLVDYPGFNLRLAQRLVDEGIARKGGGKICLLYYISPQVWAWKKNRRFKMAELLDSLAVIFPFELTVFADTKLPVTYVGHPFAQADYRLPVRYQKEAPTLLLPGSRKQPVCRIFPLMLQAWEHFLFLQPNARAVVVYPTEAIRVVLEEAMTGGSKKVADSIECLPIPMNGSAIDGGSALTSSGTMSLSVALAGIPGAIVYRAHPMTYFLGRMLIDIPYLGIANLLLDTPAWPEFIQGDASPEPLAKMIRSCRTQTELAEKAGDFSAQLMSMLSAQAQETPQDWLLNRLR